MRYRVLAAAVVASLATVGLNGCSASSRPSAEPNAALTPKPRAEGVATQSRIRNVDDYFEVEYEECLYVFDDAEVFKDFITHRETPYRKVRIGAGPDGETVVFALRGEDKKKLDGVAAIELYDQDLSGGHRIYAELWHDGRIHVFDRWQDLESYNSSVRPPCATPISARVPAVAPSSMF